MNMTFGIVDRWVYVITLILEMKKSIPERLSNLSNITWVGIKA